MKNILGGIASPNPSYPQNIDVVTGEQVVKVENVNLYNPSYRTTNNTIYAINGTATESNGVFSITATNTDMYMWQVASAGANYNQDINGELYPFTNDEYTISITNHTMIANYITFFDKNKKSLGFISFGGNGWYKTFKKSDNIVPSGSAYFTIRIGYNQATTGQTYKFSIQIEKRKYCNYLYTTPRTNTNNIFRRYRTM